MTTAHRNLIHDSNCFKRDVLEERMNMVGVKNIARMELFLWDLEIFLQLQKILVEKLVLKGGAAVQFYLPIHEQRTSVDIDMLFNGTLNEIQDALSQVEVKFPHEYGLFVFRRHQPKQPKTKLPLYTCYLQVPSVCTQREVRDANEGQQRIKVEFITCLDQSPITKVPGDTIFAMESREIYQVLPINQLLTDKLTTLGPNTIGIQDGRMDEQVKQLYDISSLLTHHHQTLSLDVMRHYYLMRAEAEAEDRNIRFDLNEIRSDVMVQLQRLRNIDDGSTTSKRNWQYILNFISLYASRSASRTMSDWVIVGEKVRLLMKVILDPRLDLIKYIQAQNIDRMLQFKHLSGAEKGHQIASFREKFIKEYGALTDINPKILKGKRLDRIFWAVADLDNLDVIERFVQEGISHPRNIS